MVLAEGAEEGHTLAQLLHGFLLPDGSLFRGIEQLSICCPAAGFRHAFKHDDREYAPPPAGGGGGGGGDYYSDDDDVDVAEEDAAAAAAAPAEEVLRFVVTFTNDDPNSRTRRFGKLRELEGFKLQACTVRDVEACSGISFEGVSRVACERRRCMWRAHANTHTHNVCRRPR